MYKDTLKGASAADSRKEVEFENLDNYVLVRDKAKRTTTIPARYKDGSNVSLFRPSGSREQDDIATYAFAIAEEEDTHEPITFLDAINSSKNDEWVRDMKEEMTSLKKNHTWELFDQPHAQGFTQRAGIDYNEVFSLVVRHTSIRVIISLTACADYELEQLDVKTAFLHGNLEETIYMRQLPGFEEGTSNKVCLLKKSLYGLEKSPRQWYKRFGVYTVSNGFIRINYDNCVFFKEFAPGMYICLLLYVDDRLIACKSKSEIECTKGLLRKVFDMKELGPARKILDMEVVRDRNPEGSLMYLMVCTRLDIAYVVSIVSRYLENPGKNHCEALKWILKYLKSTADVGLVYGRHQGKHVDVDGFVDADYAKDPDNGRSIIGYVFMAEYMALTEAVKESIWLKGLLIELGINLREIVESREVEVAIIGT
ncbi:retrovirus-related pol polyprotein from transposon TNT 1-94 [Tanacetum coccineum]